MTKTKNQLENEIIAIQDKIINAGKYVAAVCEGIPNEGTITYEDKIFEQNKKAVDSEDSLTTDSL